jgi:hypothetical protein
VLTLLMFALVPLLAWLFYLIFCAWLVKRGKPEDLEHAATAARAFPLRPRAWLSRSSNRKPPQEPG